MNIPLGQALTVLVYLSSSGTPVTGVLYSQVVLNWWMGGFTSVPVRTILQTEWLELGNGFYTMTFPKTDIDELGELFLQFTGAGFDPVTKDYFVEPTPIGFLASTTGCIVSGNTLDLAGKMLAGKQVVFRPINAPQQVNGSLIGFDRISTYTDALGNFSVNLLRGATAIVEIPDAGLTFQITVPDQSTALLLDLLPSFP